MAVEDELVAEEAEAGMASMMGFSTFGTKVETSEEKQERETEMLQKRQRSFEKQSGDVGNVEEDVDTKSALGSMELSSKAERDVCFVNGHLVPYINRGNMG